MLAGGAGDDTLDGARRRRRLLRRDRRRHHRGARRNAGADLLRRRHRRGAQRLRRHHRRVRARHRRRRRRLQLRRRLQRRDAAILPGAPEVFDNGVDEDCDGRDDPNLDRRRRRLPAPGRLRRRQRRDPAQRARDPRQRGRRELRPARRARSRDLGAVVANQWAVARAFTRLRSLVVRNAPKGARVVLSCNGRGCPFSGARGARSRATCARRAAPALPAGAPARRHPAPVTITAAETIGRTYTYVVKRGALPTSTIVCRAPGEREGPAC